MQIRAQDITDPYSMAIVGLLTQEFPGSNPEDTEAKVDALTNIIVGTNQLRRGPVPKPERLVAVRDVIRLSVEKDIAIPMMMPWGSKKTISNEPLDVAELFAIKQLQCLDRKVRQYHEPGINCWIRLEDLQVMYNFRDEINIEVNAAKYREAMWTLLGVLDAGCVTLMPETILIKDHKGFMDEATKVGYMIKESVWGEAKWAAAARDELATYGMAFAMPQEQVEFYMGKFRRFNLGKSDDVLREKVSEYIAAAVVRRKMGAVGAPDSLGGKHIKITFSPQVPGVPETVVVNELYYRTLPLRMSKMHTPPWLGKGYFEFTADKVVPHIAPWSETQHDFTPCMVELKDKHNNRVLPIHCDYVIAH